MWSRRQFDISNQNLSVDIVGHRFSRSIALLVIGLCFWVLFLITSAYLLVIVVCLLHIGRRLTVDCRVLVSGVVVGSWLSGVGGCSWFLDVGCLYWWL